MIWAGIFLGVHIALHVFHGGNFTGVKYDDMLDAYVRSYAAGIGNDFILMDNNARSHRAMFVENLKSQGLKRMEWPAQSPDLSSIEHVLDYLDRQVAAPSPPPRLLHELEQRLIRAGFSLPIEVSHNLISSMENRCH